METLKNKSNTPQETLRQLLTLKFSDEEKSSMLNQEIKELLPALDTIEQKDYLTFIENHKAKPEDTVDANIYLSKDSEKYWSTEEFKSAFLGAAYFPWQFEKNRKKSKELFFIERSTNWMEFEQLRKNVFFSCHYGYPQAFDVLDENYISNSGYAPSFLKEIVIKKRQNSIKAADCLVIPLNFGVYNEELAKELSRCFRLSRRGFDFEKLSEEDLDTYFQYVGYIMERKIDEFSVKKEFIRTVLTLKFTCWGDEVKEKLNNFCSLDENKQIIESLTKEDINSFIEEQKKVKLNSYRIEIFLPKDLEASDQNYKNAVLAAAYYPKELEKITNYGRAMHHFYVHKQLAYAAHYGHSEAFYTLRAIDSNEPPISKEYDDYIYKKYSALRNTQTAVELFFDNQQDLIKEDLNKYFSDMYYRQKESIFSEATPEEQIKHLEQLMKIIETRQESEESQS